MESVPLSSHTVNGASWLWNCACFPATTWSCHCLRDKVRLICWYTCHKQTGPTVKCGTEKKKGAVRKLKMTSAIWGEKARGRHGKSRSERRQPPQTCAGNSAHICTDRHQKLPDDCFTIYEAISRMGLTTLNWWSTRAHLAPWLITRRQDLVLITGRSPL